MGLSSRWLGLGLLIGWVGIAVPARVGAAEREDRIAGASGPAEAEPSTDEAPGEGGAIGIVWHDEATVALAARQRLVQQLREGDGAPTGPVIADASSRARARVATEIPRARADLAVRWAEILDEATAAYRAGRRPEAARAVEALLAAVRADPLVPGATTVAWRAQVLRGQIAWTDGDAEAMTAAFDAAVALDPQARLSTRQVPPPIVSAYAERRALVHADVEAWPTLTIEGPDAVPIGVEIDGVVGRRAVPPGEHLVVVRRPGLPPEGAVVRDDLPWSVPAGETVLSPGLPHDAETAERICRGAQVQSLVLARLRDGRLGLQRYACGAGFGPAWYEAREGWQPGIAAMLASVGAPTSWDAPPVLHLDAPWPAIAPPPRPPARIAAGGAPRSGRARLRRALPWMLIGGAIAGSVTVGVLVATEPRPDLAIDGDGFLRR